MQEVYYPGIFRQCDFNFDQLVKVCFDLSEKVESVVTRVNLLRQIPLFANMDGRQFQLSVSQLREKKLRNV